MPRSHNQTAGQTLLEKVSHYYSTKIGEFGATPKGVDWNGAESQRARFRAIAILFTDVNTFSLNDIGCGYGALLSYLRELGLHVDYRGLDVSEAMVEHAVRFHAGHPAARFARGTTPREPADFSVASGVFNVKLDADDRDWAAYLHDTVDSMNTASERGFAFNCLSLYSDPARRRPDLFYADPRELFDRCMRLYSRNVSLVHDYGLFEFTIIVRKTGHGRTEP